MCERLRLGTASYDLQRALALADAALGEAAPANERLDAIIDAQTRAGISGLALGLNYEARARIAIWSKDHDAFDRYSRLAAGEYRRRANSPLGTARISRRADTPWSRTVCRLRGLHSLRRSRRLHPARMDIHPEAAAAAGERPVACRSPALRLRTAPTSGTPFLRGTSVRRPGSRRCGACRALPSSRRPWRPVYMGSQAA